MLMQNLGWQTKSIMVCYGIFWSDPLKWDSLPLCCESCRHCDECTLERNNASCSQTVFELRKLLWILDLEIVSLSPPEYRCPFNWGNRYNDYVNIFFCAPNFVSRECKCPLRQRCPKEEIPVYLNLTCHGCLFFKSRKNAFLRSKYNLIINDGLRYLIKYLKVVRAFSDWLKTYGLLWR